jgi:phage baseplate assembly protein W
MSDPIQSPHFDLPFRFVGKGAAVVEQDSLQDIENCVVAALRTPIGFRTELPDFGTSDKTFQLQPLTYSELVAEIARSEPRANVVAESDPAMLMSTIAEVRLSLSAVEEEVQSGELHNTTN